MFVPLPILIAVGLVMLGLIARVLYSARPRDPLLGGQMPRARAPKPVPVATLPGEVAAQVRALLAAGRKIEAIKLARDATHMGLRETKDLVEAMERAAP